MVKHLARMEKMEINKKKIQKLQSNKTSVDSVILCSECNEPIPAARLKLLPQTTICVPCMEDLERESRGTVRHRMEFEIEGHGEEVESVQLHILRKKEK